MFLTWPKTMLLYVVFKCVCLSDMSCSWPMLLGGDEEKEKEHHPTMQDEGWITLERWVYLYVSVCHVPRICCQGVYCLSASYSPPLPSHLLLPLLITSPLPLLPSLLSPFSSPFPSSPPSLSSPLPLLVSISLLSSLLFISSPFPSFTSFSTYFAPTQLDTMGHDGGPILCCTQWWSFCPSHMKMASNLFGVSRTDTYGDLS